MKTESWLKANPFRHMLLTCRARAAKTGRSCTITENDLRRIWPPDGKCPALGVAMPLPGTRNSKKQGPRPDSPTVDRIDNSRGYEPDNIIFICWLANRIKTTANSEQVAAVAVWLSKLEQLKALL